MTKTHKAVLSTLAVLCLLFMGSGVAQAQECFAFQSGANTVRAEGMTEAVGSIQLQCRAQEAFGLPPIGDEAVISITLNTPITNETNDDGDMVMGLTYAVGIGGAALGNAANYVGEGKEVLSDGDTITWTIGTDAGDDGIDFPNTAPGATVTISGIIANASALGDGEDVTAEVSVNGVMIKHSPIKLADVTTGLDITVTSATGLQCEAGSEMATIKFVEGFASALRDTDSLVVAFRDIPEGVTVTPSMMGTGMALDMADEDADPAVIAGGDLAPLTLVTAGEMSGLDEDGNVALSSARRGQIIYTFDDEMTDTDNGARGDGPHESKGME